MNLKSVTDFSDGTWLQPIDGWIDVSDAIKVSTSNFEECNMALIVSDGEALLVDTGYEKPEAERMLKFLEQNKLKLKHIVITHHHDDHDANLSLFSMNEGQVYDPANATDGQVLSIGKKNVKLIHTPGHFPEGDISALIMDEHILISGDILYSCLPPQLSYGAKPEILVNTLKQVAAEHYHWIVPGHGKVMTGDHMTSMALSYIDNLLGKLKACADNKENLEIAKNISLSECIMHNAWMVEEPALDLHRQNIEENFEKFVETTK